MAMAGQQYKREHHHIDLPCSGFEEAAGRSTGRRPRRQHVIDQDNALTRNLDLCCFCY